MAQQSISYLQKKLMKIKQGIPASGALRYLNKLEELRLLKVRAKTVDEFLELQHLDDALAVRAGYMVQQVLQQLEDSKSPKKVKMNELFAQDVVLMNRAHMLYLTFVIFRQVVETTQFKDVQIRPLMLLLAKVYALK